MSVDDLVMLIGLKEIQLQELRVEVERLKKLLSPPPEQEKLRSVD